MAFLTRETLRQIANKAKGIDELVDSDGAVISGDRNVSNDSEIETGPVQKPYNDDSEYEKGVSTTTDRASRYKQNIPWFAVYSYGGANGRGLAIAEEKEQIDEEIKEDLVKKNGSEREVFDKNTDNKVDKIKDMIEKTELNADQLEKIKKIVLSKILSNNL